MQPSKFTLELRIDDVTKTSLETVSSRPVKHLFLDWSMSSSVKSDPSGIKYLSVYLHCKYYLVVAQFTKYFFHFYFTFPFLLIQAITTKMKDGNVGLKANLF